MSVTKICAPSDCTGCGMCQQICHQNAISMLPDTEGFLHPSIDISLCNNCGMCQRFCPVNTPLMKRKVLKVYSGWSNDEYVRINSSSGGAFTEIAKLILVKGGVVFGVAMDESVMARHIYVDNENELSKLRGSKYVQSIIGNAYREAKEFLQNGRLVLFTGTPCQIAGLYNYLRKDYSNLYTVDLICHGVPSPKIFYDYKKYIEGIIKERVTDVKFRYKKSSWIFYNMGINPHVEKTGTITHSYMGSYYADPYIRVFLRDNILRPNCYHCQYTSIERISDFTIADWWKYKAVSEADNDFEKKGVSLLMCNSEKAVNLSQNLSMKLRERTIEEASNTNLSLRRPFPKPETRDEFWSDYQKLSFNQMVKKWMYPESIPLSVYFKIYSKSRFLYMMAYFYERVLRKIHLAKYIIKVQAK